jgi:hypothetical protein
VYHFFYNIGDYSLEAAQEHGFKINSIDGDSCYKNTYRYSVNRNAISLTDGSVPAIKARVTGILDYGNARFALVDAAGQQVRVRVPEDFSDSEVRLSFNSKDVSVYSTRIDMKIC